MTNTSTATPRYRLYVIELGRFHSPDGRTTVYVGSTSPQSAPALPAAPPGRIHGVAEGDALLDPTVARALPRDRHVPDT